MILCFSGLAGSAFALLDWGLHQVTYKSTRLRQTSLNTNTAKHCKQILTMSKTKKISLKLQNLNHYCRCGLRPWRCLLQCEECQIFVNIHQLSYQVHKHKIPEVHPVRPVSQSNSHDSESENVNEKVTSKWKYEECLCVRNIIFHSLPANKCPRMPNTDPSNTKHVYIGIFSVSVCRTFD